MAKVLLVANALFVLASHSAAQAWEELHPRTRNSQALAYFASTQQVVLFGGASGFNGLIDVADTWTWDTVRWTRHRVGTTTPSAREGHAMAYGQLSGQPVVLMFGGAQSTGTSYNYFQDTWTWTPAAGWTLLSPSTSPPARDQHGLVFDTSRQRFVLFGGYGSGGALQDTWEFDSSTGNWTQKSVSAPAARETFAFVYDRNRSKSLLFGGWNGNPTSAVYYQDTWEWNGTAWSQVSTFTVDPSSRRTTGAYDPVRNRVVIFGGVNGSGAWNDTWEYDASSPGWVNRTPSSSPVARVNHSMVEGLNGVLMFGGNLTDTWNWNGPVGGASTGTWTQALPTGPAEGLAGSLAYDSVNSNVLFFGRSTTSSVTLSWQPQTRTWSGFSSGPSARDLHAMAQGPSSTIVAFGGRTTLVGVTPEQYTDQTQVWNGTTWSLMSPASRPSARAAAAACYDSTRGRTYVYGGYNGASFYGDFSSWNGTTWSSLSTGPGQRRAAGLAYDASRDRVVLFGGYNGSYLADTWEYDPANDQWSQKSPASSPTAREGIVLAYDASRSRTVLFGGYSGSYFNGTWTWNGTTWTPWDVVPRPSARAFGGMTYNPGTYRVVWFGGFDGATFSSDIWEYPYYPSTVNTIGSGCAGSNGTPTLAAALGSVPAIGTSLVMNVTNLPLSQSSAVFATGLSQYAPPVSLASIGMPGCFAYCPHDTTSNIAVSGGNASVTLPIALNSALLGVPFYNQVFVADPGTNSAGIIATNGTTSVIGGL